MFIMRGGGDCVGQSCDCRPFRVRRVPFCFIPLGDHAQLHFVLGLLHKSKPRLWRKAETAGGQAAIADNGTPLGQEHRLRRGQARLSDLRDRERSCQRSRQRSTLKAITADPIAIVPAKGRVGRCAQ